jgi:hypothetical protein
VSRIRHCRSTYAVLLPNNGLMLGVDVVTSSMRCGDDRGSRSREDGGDWKRKELEENLEKGVSRTTIEVGP